MLYYLAEYINRTLNPPGFDVFRFITWRSALAAITAMIISFWIGPKIIKRLKSHNIGEEIRSDGPKEHLSKAGTPTMGGVIVLLSVLVPVLFWADLTNTYVLLILLSTIWMGIVGFIDDYLKVVKKLKKGLVARYKLLNQVSLGVVIACLIYFLPEFKDINSITTIPFLKNFEFDFSFYYIPLMVFIITATSNAVNLTDGLDGLAIGCVGIAALALALISYVSGNEIFSRYLNIIYLPGNGELAVYCAALVGASLGFLWFNSYPAQIFMGDTGSLALGGAIGTLMILVKKEFLLPILGGIFFAESLSVIFQRLYFKYTKKKYGEGRRIFKMAPLHHHFEMLGVPEPKIVGRFYIIAVILAIVTFATFKIR
ncbi:MAG: phospho-N-acetylmuramoyl-pentapeptide-transferase [Ignavibacteriae bacterium]|nr:MAG: phospho-N-acetylmuramoyl-pentapeptide-transferase [Ignavibacteriota bacterium]